MNKKFASFLLTGKAAALPFSMGYSQADMTPSYLELTSTNINIMEIPFPGMVRLLTTTTPAASSTEGGSTSAMLCGTGLTDPTALPSSPTPTCATGVTCDTVPTNPQLLNVVVTGLKNGDVVYLAASTAKDSSALLGLNPSMRIGMDNLVSTSGVVFNSAPAQPGTTINTQDGTGTMTVPIDLTTLQSKNYAFTENSKFYLQAVAIPPGASWDGARYSELDEIVVSSQACSYGGGSTPGGGSPY